MSTVVTCRCGQSFQAQSHLAGKTVRCPKCGSGLAIPRSEAPPSNIRVACSCGQAFDAKADLAGKTVACPVCKSPLAIPSMGGQIARPVVDMGLTSLAANDPNDPLGIGGFDERAMSSVYRPPKPSKAPLAKSASKPSAKFRKPVTKVAQSARNSWIMAMRSAFPVMLIMNAFNYARSAKGPMTTGCFVVFAIIGLVGSIWACSCKLDTVKYQPKEFRWLSPKGILALAVILTSIALCLYVFGYGYLRSDPNE